ncbi:hypothetical protein COO09_17705 [Rhizorhabdus dicambivorans]|uniref:Uncharacterized protein n=2 Tax=Rhizorhabdus dicambivorans TaxID=1850238 RepID=A0A2A4FTU5_9SPHN|nr:hypothetical protein CMV14_08085 [Rhizorhabdus dicambivorans]PCE40868.1 hypothetical protein COO09_17705 [Rhizorhabdus dicambivorans]
MDTKPLWLCIHLVHGSFRMEQQPVRRRRRRRRRASSAQRETVAWLTLLFSLFQRAYHWAALLLILAVILYIGLGAPVTVLDSILSFWGHW